MCVKVPALYPACNAWWHVPVMRSKTSAGPLLSMCSSARLLWLTNPWSACWQTLNPAIVQYNSISQVWRLAYGIPLGTETFHIHTLPLGYTLVYSKPSPKTFSPIFPDSFYWRRGILCLCSPFIDFPCYARKQTINGSILWSFFIAYISCKFLLG